MLEDIFNDWEASYETFLAQESFSREAIQKAELAKAALSSSQRARQNPVRSFFDGKAFHKNEKRIADAKERLALTQKDLTEDTRKLLLDILPEDSQALDRIRELVHSERLLRSVSKVQKLIRESHDLANRTLSCLSEPSLPRFIEEKNRNASYETTTEAKALKAASAPWKLCTSKIGNLVKALDHRDLANLEETPHWREEAKLLADWASSVDLGKPEFDSNPLFESCTLLYCLQRKTWSVVDDTCKEVFGLRMRLAASLPYEIGKTELLPNQAALLKMALKKLQLDELFPADTFHARKLSKPQPKNPTPAPR